MKEKEMESSLAREVMEWLSDDEGQLKFVFGHEVQDEDLEEVQRASLQVVKSLLQPFATISRIVCVTRTSIFQPVRLRSPASKMRMDRGSLWKGLLGASRAIWW